MTNLPTGTVTFLFSDIEGSTRLLQACGERWPELLRRHQELIRSAVAEHGGMVVGTEGDSFFAVFPSAAGALAAAVAAQRALTAEPWPEEGEIRVRIGMHTGEALVAGETYVGLDVHRAARIMGAGHGGQILVSASTEPLVRQSLPDGVALEDLGAHRLKDLTAPEHLYTVTADGLPAEFPPLRTVEAAPNNLPTQLTSFVGREAETAEVATLVQRHRIVTLTGPGGTGKTRLSIQVATDLMDRFPDGVYFVRLAPIREVELVLPTIGQAVGLPQPGRQPLERLAAHIGDRRLLLVLDNLEQVIDAAADIGELLKVAPQIRVLATSRSPLRIYGEQEFPVPPLTLPDPRNLPPGVEISQYPAVALFVERARAVRPGFEVTPDNAAAVAEICWRLDGLPLAIELAAARIRILSPDAMLARLTSRLDIGSAGARDLPARQQTLRGAIEWSYEILDDADRRFFARFSVFVGGASLDAMEAVIGDGDVLELAGSLLDKSLMRQQEEVDGVPRFRMLETIREYAHERLRESDEVDDLRRRHARYYTALAERVAANVFSDRQKELLDEMERDHDNVRAAITAVVELGERELGLRLLAASWRFWQMRGYLSEGRERAHRILAAADEGAVDELLRARAEEAAGGLSYWQGEMEDALEHYQSALDIHRRLGAEGEIANALYNVALAFSFPELEAGGFEVPAEGRASAEEALEIYRRLGDRSGEGRVLWCILDMDILERRPDEGISELGSRCLEIFTETDDRFMLAWTEYMLGLHDNINHRPTAALERYRRALELFHESGDVSGYALAFDGIAAAAFIAGDRQRSMLLAGAASAVQSQTGAGLGRINRVWSGFHPERLVEEPELAKAFEEGRHLPLDEALALARATCSLEAPAAG